MDGDRVMREGRRRTVLCYSLELDRCRSFHNLCIECILIPSHCSRLYIRMFLSWEGYLLVKYCSHHHGYSRPAEYGIWGTRYPHHRAGVVGMGPTVNDKTRAARPKCHRFAPPLSFRCSIDHHIPFCTGWNGSCTQNTYKRTEPATGCITVKVADPTHSLEMHIVGIHKMGVLSSSRVLSFPRSLAAIQSGQANICGIVSMSPYDDCIPIYVQHLAW
ncbi:hypothetical protein OF83DRAFT_685296 [Amylostereum chailletii]|nr:hypothetical protein OF83DRAFT_685296 [Amylostereum chailletii]